jgi:GT2 family glycosyltransferase
MWATFTFYGTAALFLAWTLSTLHHLRWVRRLPALTRPSNPNGSTPHTHPPTRCSVIVAARDEEPRIEQAIHRLLQQHHVELELIAVDDRSTDRTHEILRRLAQTDPRIRVQHVDALPDGWLGKCHACHLGASLASGDWILFTDADCWLKPDVIARALETAEREHADHITLTSGLAAGDASLHASHLMFLISLANWFSGVNRDRPEAFMGIGAFNLVRASAYRDCGGYEMLRLTVVDDMKLGLLLRRAGKRTRAFLGGDEVACDWGTRAWDTVRVMEKNYFAAADYRTGLVAAGSAFVILLFTLLGLGLVSGTVAGLSAALSPFLLALPAGVLARRLRWPLAHALWVPFMPPLFLYAVLRSTVVTLRQQGVRWRGTFYPLARLRTGNVR